MTAWFAKRLSERVARHVALGDKSLKKVWAWCEQNNQTRLAKSYFSACGCIGELLEDDATDELEKYYPWGWPPPKRKKSAYMVIGDMKELAFTNRDEIGRAILAIIKIEDKGGGNI
jgi:hypothetical protein